jgi:hypothetical protein
VQVMAVCDRKPSERKWCDISPMNGALKGVVAAAHFKAAELWLARARSRRGKGRKMTREPHVQTLGTAFVPNAVDALIELVTCIKTAPLVRLKATQRLIDVVAASRLRFPEEPFATFAHKGIRALNQVLTFLDVIVESSKYSQRTRSRAAKLMRSIEAFHR